MRVPTQRRRPRKSKLASFPVPTAGLISNRNLAQPTGQNVPPGAETLINWFPTPSTAILRRGLRRRATLPNGETVKGLFTYVLGQQKQLFAATDDGVWDVTTVASPYDWAVGTDGEDEAIGTEGGDAIGAYSVSADPEYAATDGDWVTVQFSTAGGTYVIGVNGVDPAFIYDGTDFWPYVAGGVQQLGVTITDAFEDGETMTGPATVQYGLDSLSGTFSAGETVTGGTSAETAVVMDASPTSITLRSLSGPLTPGETITGGTSSATAEVVGAGDDVTPSATVLRSGVGMIYLTGVTGEFVVGDAVVGDVAGTATVTDAPVLIAPGIEGIASTRLAYVWTYKKRLWFIERDSLNAWYLPVDQVGGTATVLPMGGVFNRGGSLLWGQTWSLDSSGDGGLSEQCVFTTTEGEVAAYQGISPDDAQTWSKVGVYRIGTPLGKNAFIRAGGDLVVATSIGFIPLGRAIQSDYAALGLIAISQPIADEWRRAVDERGAAGWICELWGEGSMTLVAPPPVDGPAPQIMVANSDSGAWSLFVGWSPTAIVSFMGGLVIGSTGGRVQNAWIGGNDEGDPYTGVMVPLFNDLGSPGQRKIAKFARVVKRSAVESAESVQALWDWDMTIPAAPDAAPVTVGAEWDNAIWDESIWDSERGTFITEAWNAVGGSGFAASVVVQVTSGNDVPLDVEVIRMDFSFELADIIT